VATIDLVVTDLDGTLWHADTDFLPAVRQAWDELRSHVPVLVATGRRIVSTRAPFARVGLAPPAVVLNGALGLDLATGRRFHRSPFPVDQAVAVLDAFRSAGIDPCVYVDGEGDGDVLVSPTPSTHPGHLESLGTSARMTDLAAAVADIPVLGFGLIGVEHSRLARAGAAIDGTAEVHLDRSLDYPGLAAITVAPKGQSKWDGVQAFCDEQGLDASRVLTVADGANDIELLSRSAVRVVPTGAHQQAEALADHTIPPAGEGGWAEVPALVEALNR
jgi:hydroxymethylpyrimidine pyrophosphatase-like HAD family hydrolase